MVDAEEVSVAPMAGSHNVAVRSLSGLLSSSASDVEIDLTIANSTFAVSGSGGRTIRVDGTGFPATYDIAVANGMTVTVGGATCKLVESGETYFTC